MEFNLGLRIKALHGPAQLFELHFFTGFVAVENREPAAIEAEFGADEFHIFDPELGGLCPAGDRDFQLFLLPGLP